MIPLRHSTTQHEIRSILDELHLRKSLVTLWQSAPFGRTITDGQIRSYDHQTLDLCPYDGRFDFKRERPLYFYCETHKHVLFKSTQHRVGKNLISIPNPESIRLIELRSEIRHRFYATGRHHITFDKPVWYGKNFQSFTCRLDDVSGHGASIFVEAAHMPVFQRDDAIVLKRIGATDLEAPISGRIVYLRPIQDRGTNAIVSYRVGLQFGRKIRLDLFPDLIQ